MTKTEVCVIGAGALGLFTAYELACRGVDVVVLDREHPAAGTSGASAGIIETQYLDRIDIEIRAWSMRRLLELEASHGLEITHNGYLRLGHDHQALDRFEQSVEIQGELGIEGPTVLEPSQIAHRLPGVDTADLVGGLFGPNDGFLDGHQLCGILKELIVAEGSSVISGAGVNDLHVATGGFVIETAGADWAAEQVVNAAGAWAPVIGEMVGVSLPISPQRHQTCLLEPDPPLPGLVPSVMDYVPGSGVEGLYFRYEQPRQLLAGLHTEEPVHGSTEPDNFSRETDSSYLDRVAERFLRRFPRHDASRVAPGWAGLYPMAPDRMALVGATEVPGFHVCGGAGGSGIQSSPAYGRIAADSVCGSVSLPSIAAVLRPDRLARSFTRE